MSREIVIDGSCILCLTLEQGMQLGADDPRTHAYIFIQGYLAGRQVMMDAKIVERVCMPHSALIDMHKKIFIGNGIRRG